MTIKEIEAQVAGVEGWLNLPEGRLLNRLARRCKGRGAIVEIGSFKGKSTIWLGHGSLAGRGQKIHAIDPHCGVIDREQDGAGPTFAEFQRNIREAGVEKIVEPHVDFSDAVAREFSEPVELIFVDGLHDYESVRSDFEAWFPKVIEGGTMAFHDTTGQSGAHRFAIERVYKSQHFKKIRFARSITYAQKTAQNTALERLENRLMLCAMQTYAFVYRQLFRLKRRVKKSRPQLQLEPA
jgi:predicted O-methyltransferase YrrM